MSFWTAEMSFWTWVYVEWGKWILIFLLLNYLYVYVSNVMDHHGSPFLEQLPVCQAFRFREDKRKWWFLKQVQSGTTKQCQSLPWLWLIITQIRDALFLQEAILSYDERMTWTITKGAFECLDFSLVIFDIYSFFKFILLLRMDVSTVLCWRMPEMHSRVPGVLWVVNSNLNILNP